MTTIYPFLVASSPKMLEKIVDMQIRKHLEAYIFLLNNMDLGRNIPQKLHWVNMWAI